VTDYHSIDAVNCSGLKLFAESEAEYYYKYVAKTWEGEQSDAFRLGSFTHTKTLEPEKIETEWEKVDPPTGKGKDAKPLKSGKDYNTWHESMMKRKDHRWYTSDEDAEVTEWVKALRNHSMIQAILEHPERQVEKTLLGTWEHDAFGEHDFKGRCDLIIPSQKILVDVKTAVSELPGKFRRIAYSLDYHMQAALYKYLAESKYGEGFRFFFAVVSKSEKRSSLIELPEEMMQQGMRKLIDKSAKLIASKRQWSIGENIPGDWRSGVCICS